MRCHWVLYRYKFSLMKQIWPLNHNLKEVSTRIEEKFETAAQKKIPLEELSKKALIFKAQTVAKLHCIGKVLHQYSQNSRNKKHCDWPVYEHYLVMRINEMNDPISWYLTTNENSRTKVATDEQMVGQHLSSLFFAHGVKEKAANCFET